MTPPHESNLTGGWTPPPQRELDLGQFFRAVLRYKWGMAVVFILTVLAATVRTVYFLDRIYAAEATLLPLKTNQSGGLAMLRNLGAVGDLLGTSINVGGSDKERLVNVLESKDMLAETARELNVVQFLTRKDYLKEQKHAVVQPTDSGRIALELVNAHPEIVYSVADDPEQGILSMSDETLRRMTTTIPGFQGDPTDSQLAEIRRSWHLCVERALNEFDEAVTIRTRRVDDLLTVSVEMPYDAQLAANIANRFVDKLEIYLKDNTLTQAQNNREFLKNRLELVTSDLQAADLALEAFKSRHNLPALDDQTTALVSTYGQAIAELQSAEIKRDALLSTGRSPLSAEIRALNTQAQMLQANVRKLEAGGGNYLSRSGLQKLPMLEREYVVLMRERTVQETLFAMMAQEFEVAKIQESQDEMRFQSLDRARPRAKPIRPSNRANAMIGAMLGGVLSGAYALLRLTIAGNAAPRRDPEPIT